MTARRPDRVPLEAIEVGLRRLRLVGLVLLALVVVVPGGHRPDTIGLALLAGLAVLAVAVDRAPARLEALIDRPDRIVAMQIGTDVLITVGALVIIDPGPADGLWMIVAFPVIEGAVRYGVLGGMTVWLTTALPVLGWVIADWAPGDGLSTITETGGLLALALAVGLPAGSVAEHLVDELAGQDLGRRDLDGQAQLISVLAVAAGDLSTSEPSELCRILVEAAVGLGFPGAEIALVDTATMAHHPLASEPPGYATGAAGATEVVRSGRTAPGTVHLGSAGELAGIVASAGTTVTVLAVGTTGSDRWQPRTEAFELLSRYGAAAMAAATQRLRVAESFRQLEHRRTHDPVTGVLNRTGFEAAVGDVLDRLAPGTEAQVFTIDLDSLVSLDSLAGLDPADSSGETDRVLTEVAARLERSAPTGSAVARIDHDRFGLVTDRATGPLGHHLRDVLARPIATASGVVVVQASIGQVVTTDPTVAPAAVIAEAENRARAGTARASQRHRSLS